MLAALVNATTDAVYLKDIQGRYLLFNGAAEALTGKSAAEVLGKDDTAVFAPAEAAVVMEGDRHAMARLIPVTYEETVTDAAGVVRTFLSTKGPVRDEAGTLLGLFGIARDITDRVTAGEQLRLTTERLRRFFAAPFVGTLIVGPDGVLQEANDYFLDLVGRTRDELERGAIDMPAMTPPEWQPVTDEALAVVRTGGSAVPYEKEYMRPDGTRVSVLVANTVLPGPDQLIGSFVLDNTVRTAADRALRESEERFRVSIESANDAIFIWDRDLRCLEANRAACERLGYTRAELLGMTAAQISAPEQGDVATRAEAIALRGSGTVESVHLARDGTRIPVEVSTTVTSLGGRPVFLSIARDVTERKRAEADAAVANERVHQFFNAGIIGTLVARPDGTIVEANDYFLAMIGRTRDEFERNEIDWRLITPPEQLSLTDRSIAGMQALGRGGSYEKEYLRPDGTRVQALVVAGAMPGTTDQGAAFVLDISDRKRTEARLVEQTALLQSVLESSEAAVFAVDREYRYTAFNAQHAEVMRALYGVEIELGLSLLDYQHTAGDDVAAKRNLARALAGERFTDEGFSGEAGRTQAYFEVTHAPVRDPAGVIVGASVFARDTTGRKRAEQQLRILEQAIQSQTSGFVLADLQGNLTQVNAAFLRLWGYGAPEEILGRSALEFVQRPEEVADSLRIVGSAGAWTGEIEAKRKDGSSFPVQVAASLVKDGDGKPLCTTALFEDNTDRKLAAQLVAAARDSLEEAQRVAHVGSWKLDPVADEITASAEFFRLFDAAPEEIVHYQQFVERLHPDDRERVNRDVAAALEENQPYDTEYRVRLRDGGWRDLSARGQVVTDADGKPLRFVGTCLDITERKRADEALRLSQARYKTIVDNIPQKVFVKGLDLRWASINDLLARDFGLRPEDVVGKTNRELFPQDLADKYSADDQRIIETGATEEFDEEYLDQGERRMVHSIKTPVRDDSGTIRGVFGVFWDVTDERRAADELRLAHERLRRLVDASLLGVFEARLEGTVVEANDYFLNLVGHTRAELDRGELDWLAMIAPESRLSSDDAVREMLMRGSASYEKEYVRPDGTRVPVLAVDTLLPGPEQLVAGFVLDITERKRAEEALLQSERWYRSLSDSLPHLVWTCQADGPCDYLSPRWVAYTGIPESEQLGYRWLEQLHPDDRERVIAEWAAVAAHGDSFDIEFRIRRADGMFRWFKTRAIPLRDNDGQVVKWFGSNTDIDDSKRAEEEIRDLNAGLEARVVQRTVALEAANRELEAFSYSVSHDLRAPLRSIHAFSQILLDEHAAALDAEGERLLGVVLRNTKQMGTLIDDLLAFSRVSRAALDHHPVDMARLAQSVADEVQTAEPDREITFDIGRLAHVPGDAALLRQVWVNLLGNAVKFSMPVAHATVEVRSEQVEGECRYTVRDNGVGFDPAYLDKLFVPFSRLHPTADFEGTGIGLAIVARIVTRHGGRVWADGTPGGGATFGFALPTGTEAT